MRNPVERVKIADTYEIGAPIDPDHDPRPYGDDGGALCRTWSVLTFALAGVAIGFYLPVLF